MDFFLKSFSVKLQPHEVHGELGYDRSGSYSYNRNIIEHLYDIGIFLLLIRLIIYIFM